MGLADEMPPRRNCLPCRCRLCGGQSETTVQSPGQVQKVRKQVTCEPCLRSVIMFEGRWERASDGSWVQLSTQPSPEKRNALSGIEGT